MVHRYLLPFFVLCLAAAAAGAIPLSAIVTYPQFETLLKDSARRVPELRPLWTWNAPEAQPAHAGGGAIRGLVHWLYRELQRHTPREILALHVPPIGELLLQLESDLDIFTRDNLIDELREDRPEYAKWDILPDSFYAASVASGGTTLEKLKVNPVEIVDPLGGLRHYYDGKLVFHVTPDSDMRGSDIVRDNSRLAQALRFLRIGVNLPELALDKDSMKFIRSIAELEGPLLRRSKGTDYWIEKAVKKLWVATGRDRERTLAILRDANLHDLLESKGYDLSLGRPPSCAWMLLGIRH